MTSQSAPPEAMQIVAEWVRGLPVGAQMSLGAKAPELIGLLDRALRAAQLAQAEKDARIAEGFKNCEHDEDPEEDYTGCTNPCHACCSDCNHDFIAAAIRDGVKP